MTPAAIRKAIRGRVSCDSVSVKKDGEVWIKLCYFYRHGFTAEKFGEYVGNKLKGIGTVIRTEDRWNSWPKQSYFLAVARMSESSQ